MHVQGVGVWGSAPNGWAPFIGIGPDFEARVGAYSKLDVALPGGSGSETIRNQALQGWLTFGVRVDPWP